MSFLYPNKFKSYSELAIIYLNYKKDVYSSYGVFKINRRLSFHICKYLVMFDCILNTNIMHSILVLADSIDYVEAVIKAIMWRFNLLAS